VRVLIPFNESVNGKVVCPGCKAKFESDEFTLFMCDAKLKFKKTSEECKTLEFRPRGDNVCGFGKEWTEWNECESWL